MIRVCSTCPSKKKLFDFDPYASKMNRTHARENWLRWLSFFLSFFCPHRLTLVLSCAMKFESYPHDTQVCSMMIESCKWPPMPRCKSPICANELAHNGWRAMHLINWNVFIRFFPHLLCAALSICSVPYGARFSIHLEYDRSAGCERRHWVATTRHFKNFHHRLYHRVFDGEFYLLGSCI